MARQWSARCYGVARQREGSRPNSIGGSGVLCCVQLGDLPGIGMTIIDGIVRTQRSRNTPPATKVPVTVGH
jgi:hypothetical protein